MNGPFAWFKWEALFTDYHIFLEGLIVTIEVGLLGLALAIILGTISGVMSTSKIKLLRIISREYDASNCPFDIEVIPALTTSEIYAPW